MQTHTKKNTHNAAGKTEQNKKMLLIGFGWVKLDFALWSLNDGRACLIKSICQKKDGPLKTRARLIYICMHWSGGKKKNWWAKICTEEKKQTNNRLLPLADMTFMLFEKKKRILFRRVSDQRSVASVFSLQGEFFFLSVFWSRRVFTGVWEYVGCCSIAGIASLFSVCSVYH